MRVNIWRNRHLPLLLIPLFYQLLRAAPPVPSGALFLELGLFCLVILAYSKVVLLFEGWIDETIASQQDPFSKGYQRLLAERSFRVGGYLLLSCLLWRWLPASPVAWGLMASGYLLVLLYCLPPTHWKRGAILGLLTRGLFVYTIPCLMATFVGASINGSVPTRGWLLVVVLWSFPLGVRHIVSQHLELVSVHQLNKIATAVTVRGWKWSFEFLAGTLFYIETLGFLALLTVISLHTPLVILGFSLHLARILFWQRANSLSREVNLRHIPVVNRVVLCNKLILDEFQWQWLPVLILLPLLMRGVEYGGLVLVYCILFQNGIRQWIQSILSRLRSASRSARRLFRIA